MTIGVDIRTLTRGIHTGVEEYTVNLLSHIIRLAPHVKFKLFSNSFKKISLDYDWIGAPNVEIFQSKIPNKIFSSSSRFLNIPKADLLVGGADVFFSPHFLILPLSKSCKRVITFHDLSFIRYPEFFSLRQNIWHRFQMNPKLQVRKSDAIIAVSESTKSDLMEFFRISSEKIHVIYSGINEIFLRNHISERGDGIKKKYGLPDNYILFLGTLEPRKNIIGIIKAFELVSEDQRFNNLNLVIAGNNGWQADEILKIANKSVQKSKFFFSGPIESHERKFFYQNARLFVYPSFFEGFGFPPLEAMASGVPVITSSTSSLPEVVGDGAFLTNPYNIGEIADGIKLLLSDDKIRDFYNKKGKEVANKFSWEKSAKATLDVLTGL